MLQVSKLIPQGQGLAQVLVRRAAQLELDWDVRQKSRFDAETSDGRLIFSTQVSAVLQGQVERIYGRFLGLVSKSRGKSPADIDKIAQGRIWDGGTARQLGLVDEFAWRQHAAVFQAQHRRRC